MRTIWITTDWEPNPMMGDASQLGRMHSLAKYLAEEGYQVVIWFTTFSHVEKKYVECETKIKKLSDHLSMVLLHSKVKYVHNMDPRRYLYYECLAREMQKMMFNDQRIPKPDLLFCSYPPEQFCRVSIKYAKKNKIPVIIDARDMWPDIFERAFPVKVKCLSNLVLAPLRQKAKRAFANADALCSMSPVILKWALAYAGRAKSSKDRYLFISSPGRNKSEILDQEIQAWKDLGVSDRTWNICFFSNLSKTSVDLDTVIKGIQKVHKSYPEVRLIVGGNGDEKERLQILTSELDYIHIMGWLNKRQMDSLMSISKIGLLCYRNTVDFRDGWGNKVGQYLSYGLPLMTPVTGYARRYIKEYQCGALYNENDEDSFAKSIISMIEHPERQEVMSQNASRQFEEDFEYSRVMRCFQTMIEDVMKEGKE